jgi:hypothetical protein
MCRKAPTLLGIPRWRMKFGDDDVGVGQGREEKNISVFFRFFFSDSKHSKMPTMSCWHHRQIDWRDRVCIFKGVQSTNPIHSPRLPFLDSLQPSPSPFHQKIPNHLSPSKVSRRMRIKFISVKKKFLASIAKRYKSRAEAATIQCNSALFFCYFIFSLATIC